MGFCILNTSLKNHIRHLRLKQTITSMDSDAYGRSINIALALALALAIALALALALEAACAAHTLLTLVDVGLEVHMIGKLVAA